MKRPDAVASARVYSRPRPFSRVPLSLVTDLHLRNVAFYGLSSLIFKFACLTASSYTTPRCIKGGQFYLEHVFIDEFSLIRRTDIPATSYWRTDA